MEDGGHGVIGWVAQRPAKVVEYSFEAAIATRLDPILAGVIALDLLKKAGNVMKISNVQVCVMTNILFLGFLVANDIGVCFAFILCCLIQLKSKEVTCSEELKSPYCRLDTVHSRLYELVQLKFSASCLDKRKVKISENFR